MANLSVLILTHNEEIHIARAISSVASLGATVFVVDSFSTDSTCDIARSAGAVIVQHPFLTQGQQLKWALAALPIKTDWVLRLDADEVVTEELAEEIAQRLPELSSDISAVYINLRYIFMGRKLMHGGRHLQLLRLFRPQLVTVVERWMDERFELLSGRSIVFKHHMHDSNLKDISFFIDKHNRYSTREAIEVMRSRYSLWKLDDQSAFRSYSVKIKSTMKYASHKLVPFWVGSFAYFIYRYVILLGFLDGREGFIYHLIQGLWYRFLVGAKVEEYDRVLRLSPNSNARIMTLAKLTSYPLEEYVLRGDARVR